MDRKNQMRRVQSLTLVHNAHMESITKTKHNFLSAICSLSPIAAVILGENKAGGCCSADGLIFCEMLDQAGDFHTTRSGIPRKKKTQQPTFCIKAAVGSKFMPY